MVMDEPAPPRLTHGTPGTYQRTGTTASAAPRGAPSPMTDMQSARRPGRRLILLPIALLFLLAILWSGAWFWAANYAGTTIDRFLAQEAAAGRRYACADRHV